MIFWYERVSVGSLNYLRRDLEFRSVLWSFFGGSRDHLLRCRRVHVGDNSLQEQSVEPSGLFFHTDTNTVDLNRLGWLVGWCLLFFFLISNVFVSFTLIFLVKGVLL